MSESSKKAIIEILNEVLTAELTAINQYFIHAELCNHWGFKRLYKEARMQSIDEMKHAELLIERVLFLNGIPNVQRLGKISIGETVREQFQLDSAVEGEAVSRLNRGIMICRENGDIGSAMLLETILKSEEEHFDWLRTQLELLDKLGEQGYLANQVNEA
jgi:bacterioferritin